MYRISKQSRWNRLLISAISARFWSLSYSSFDFCPGCWNAVYTRLRLRCSWFFPFIHLLFRENVCSCAFLLFQLRKNYGRWSHNCFYTYILLKDSTNWRFEKKLFVQLKQMVFRLYTFTAVYSWASRWILFDANK